MTTDSVNTRELILEILLEVTERGQYSHLVIRSVLEKYQYLDKRERAFLTRVAEGTIQRQIELDYILDQFSKVKVRKETGDPRHSQDGRIPAEIYGQCTGHRRRNER